MNYQDMLKELSGAIREIAREELLPRFNTQTFDQQTKHDGSVVTEADGAAQESIAKFLRSRWPGIAFLGEEMDTQEQQRLMQSKSVWCLDPLDGTSNFATGIPFFGVSLALIENQQQKLGLIFDPVRDECFTALNGEGCWLNGVAISAFAMRASLNELKQMIAVVDLKRLRGPLLNALATEHPFRSQRNFGSCALEWCWLAAGRFQLYIHGGQKLWDYAAGTLILQEAGGISSSLAGDAVFNASLEPRPVVAGFGGEAYTKWYAWIDQHKQ